MLVSVYLCGSSNAVDAAKEERIHLFVCPVDAVGGGGSLLVLELVGEPVEAFVEAVAAGGTRGLDVPVSVT